MNINANYVHKYEGYTWYSHIINFTNFNNKLIIYQTTGHAVLHWCADPQVQSSLFLH